MKTTTQVGTVAILIAAMVLVGCSDGQEEVVAAPSDDDPEVITLSYAFFAPAQSFPAIQMEHWAKAHYTKGTQSHHEGAPTACTYTVSGSISLPSQGFFSPRMDDDVLSGAEIEAVISGRSADDCEEAAGATRIKRLRDTLGNQMVSELLVKNIARRGYMLAIDKKVIRVI